VPRQQPIAPVPKPETRAGVTIPETDTTLPHSEFLQRERDRAEAIRQAGNQERMQSQGIAVRSREDVSEALSVSIPAETVARRLAERNGVPYETALAQVEKMRRERFGGSGMAPEGSLTGGDQPWYRFGF